MNSTLIAPAIPQVTPAETPAAFFAANGYYVARGMYRGQELAELQQDYDRILRQISGCGEETNARWMGEENDRLGQGIVQHTHNAHRYSTRWLHAFQKPALLDLAEQFLGGPDIVLHHTKLFYKPAGNGAPFPSHQDWEYFPMRNNQCIAATVYVEDADERNGCLRMIPGSHKEGRISNAKGGGEISDLQRRYPIEMGTAIEGKAGDVIFFHCLTVHGSLMNTGDQSRKTVLVQLYNAQDVAENQGGHFNDHLLLRGWNPHMTRNHACDM